MKGVKKYHYIYIYTYTYIDIYTTHDTEGNTKDSRVKLKQATGFPLKKITESRSGDSKKNFVFQFSHHETLNNPPPPHFPPLSHLLIPTFPLAYSHLTLENARKIPFFDSGLCLPGS